MAPALARARWRRACARCRAPSRRNERKRARLVHGCTRRRPRRSSRDGPRSSCARTAAPQVDERLVARRAHDEADLRHDLAPRPRSSTDRCTGRSPRPILRARRAARQRRARPRPPTTPRHPAWIAATSPRPSSRPGPARSRRRAPRPRAPRASRREDERVRLLARAVVRRRRRPAPRAPASTCDRRALGPRAPASSSASARAASETRERKPARCERARARRQDEPGGGCARGRARGYH